jgi:uncharacterized protein YceH (UPF0502 family)
MDRESADEIKRHLDVVAEALRSDIRVVADAVAATNERLDRFEARVAEEFVEVKAMIRLSFGQLDQRIRALEENMASLRSRLDRLEDRNRPS